MCILLVHRKNKYWYGELQRLTDADVVIIEAYTVQEE
jgi:hypothetical protein